MISCYPLSVTRAKWKIRWDKELKKGKESYTTHAKSKESSPPNIVLIVADDLSPYEVSAYGVDHISTPHIDQIGKEGVVFKEAYATAPTCAPARAAWLRSLVTTLPVNRAKPTCGIS